MSPLVLRTTGQWSNTESVTIRDKAYGNKVDHSLIATAWSSLAREYRAPVLHLFQDNYGPEVTKSIKSISYKHSLMALEELESPIPRTDVQVHSLVEPY
ncbi:hypothetical protein PanWU01x14_235830 [Parasponia andersonii]|uniref:Uncharacterized protein n=1 Tax=Parasponia andersonii TaxID=3476 RepID=A0A2P5BIW8_PARAD|nr:hypothetical protein PanWU01x14_235830 [Parasponia andersonii]